MNNIREFIKQQNAKTVGINEIAAELNLKKRVVIEDLREFLQEIIRKNPNGLTITDLTSIMKINRNWIAKQLDLLFLSGKVQRKQIGPAKVYSISQDGLTKWEKYYLALLENSSDLIIVLTEENEGVLGVDFVSQSVKRILGYSPKELENLNFLDLIHPEERERLQNYSELFDEGGSEYTLYMRWNTASNKWKHLEVIVTDLTNDRNVHGLVLNCKDISETIRLEEQIQFRVIFEKFLFDLSTKFIDIPFDKLDQIIANGLASIGKFFIQNTLPDYTVSPDQISMYLFSGENDHMLCSHQWISKVGSTILTSNVWASSDYDALLEYFKQTDLTYHSSLSSISPKVLQTMKTIFSDKIQAFILIPLFNQEDSPLGFVVFQFLTEREKWTESAIEMLKGIGTIIQSALRNLSRNIDTALYEYFFNRRMKRNIE